MLRLLAHDAELAPNLRQFELTLLAQLGYGLDYQHDSSSGEAIVADAAYRLVEDEGFVRAEPADPSAPGQSIPGWVLLAIAAGDFQQAQVLHTAKRLNQQSLAPLIGSAPLVSRSLYTGNPRG